MKWYKMDCDAQENLDMRKLVDEWGWDWYGRYWAILGKIGMLVNERRQTFALQTNDGRPFPVKLLSDDLSTTVERLTSFCNFLADNHLIDKRAWYKKGLIYSPKLKDRCDEYTDKLLRKSRHSPAQEVEEEVDIDKKKIRIKRHRDTPKDEAPPKQKEPFGEFQNVFLTQTERGRLTERLESDERAKAAIEILSAYKQSKGKKYESDYATFTSWVIGELEKREGTGKAGSRTKRETFTSDTIERIVRSSTPSS